MELTEFSRKSCNKILCYSVYSVRSVYHFFEIAHQIKICGNPLDPVLSLSKGLHSILQG